MLGVAGGDDLVLGQVATSIADLRAASTALLEGVSA